MKKVREVEPEGFAEFWAAWQPMARHTDGRGLARDAYRKQLLNGALPEDINDGARWFLRGVQDRQYVPLAATWLNREPWPDLCEQERAFQQRMADRQQRETATTNVTPIRQEEPIDNEARARHANALLARAGFRAAGE